MLESGFANSESLRPGGMASAVLGQLEAAALISLEQEDLIRISLNEKPKSSSMKSERCRPSVNSSD